MKPVPDPGFAWWLGTLGLAGALLLVVGDQCLYFAPVSGAQFQSRVLEIAAKAPTARALFGAGLAPIAVLLYLAGFTHVYLHTRQRHPRLAALIWIGLALCILAGGAYHVLWGAKVLVLKAAGASAAPAAGAMALYGALHRFAAGVYSIAEFTGYPAILLLALVIASGPSGYPRWFCLLVPAVPMLVLQTITPWIPAPFGSLAGGSAVNLSFALFFAVSLAVTRMRTHRPKALDPDAVPPAQVRSQPARPARSGGCRGC
ncbi:MAG TPA: DUF6796 family protein [Rhodanobacteraceae bacterium]|nr:DUF6796 family protein [Rhodanobacteraceae bacterium]